MAHECPECGYACHCGGDIEDCCWGLPTHYCTHCDPYGYQEDDSVEIDQ